MMRRHNITGSEVGQGRPLAYMRRGRTHRANRRGGGGRTLLLAALLLIAVGGMVVFSQIL